MTINKFDWILTLLEDMMSSNRKGKLMEIRNDGGKLIVSCYLEQMPPKEYENYKKKLDLNRFFGKLEFNYAGNGSHTIRIVASLTEADVAKNPHILKSSI